MPNYKFSKVYKIYSPSQPNLLCYIGVTTQPLFKRMWQHKNVFENNKKYQETAHSIISESYDYIIELIEKFPCDCLEELNKRKGYWIRKLKCVNKNIIGRTHKEYYEDNKERISDYRKEYYQDNKELIIDRYKKYYQNNREQILDKYKKYYEDNVKEKRDYYKKYYQKNRKRIGENQKKYSEKNRKRISEYQKKYCEKNRKRICEHQKKYIQNKKMKLLKIG